MKTKENAGFPEIEKVVSTLYGNERAMFFHQLAIEGEGVLKQVWERIRHGRTVNGERAMANDDCRRRCPLGKVGEDLNFHRVVAETGKAVDVKCTGFPSPDCSSRLARLDIGSIADGETSGRPIEVSELPCGMNPPALFAALKSEAGSEPLPFSM